MTKPFEQRPYDLKVQEELRAHLNLFQACGWYDHFLRMDELVSSPMKGLDEEDLEFTIPLIDTQVETQAGHLAAMFCAINTIFRIAKAPETSAGFLTSVSRAMERYATRWKWQHEVLLGCCDASTYNLVVMEGKWVELKTETRAPSAGRALEMASLRAGFRIKRIDPLNAFWDPTLPPSEISEFGDFAGYHEQMSAVRLRNFLQEECAPTFWQSRMKDLLDDYGSGEFTVFRKRPEKSDGPKKANDVAKPSLDALWTNGRSTSDSRKIPQRLHTVTHEYWRGVPADIGVNVVPKPNTSQTLLLRVLNGKYLIDAKVVNNYHRRLPILIANPMNRGEGITARALPDRLKPLQKLSSVLISQDVKSSRSAVAGRKLVNALMIDTEKLKGNEVFIGVKQVPPGQSLRSAMEDVSHNDPVLGVRTDQALRIYNFGYDMTGQNSVTQGGFVKGNKTNAQFQETVAGSSRRQILTAIGFDTGIITPLGEILLSDLRQFAGDQQVYNQETGEMETLSREQLATIPFSFDLSAGLRAALNAAATAAMAEGMTLAAQNPALGGDMKLGQMFAHIMANQGAAGFEQFVKTAEDKQAEQLAVLQQQAAMQAIQSTGAVAENAATQPTDGAPPQNAA